MAERIEATDSLLARGIPPERLVIGTGCPAIGDTIELSKHATDAGAAGVLVMPPYLFKSLDPAGVIEWFRSLLDAIAGLRLYLYHYPDLSGVPIENALIDALLETHPRGVMGVKDSSGNPATLSRFLAYADQLAVMPGSENRLMDALTGGGRGIITAGANVNAAGIVTAVASSDPEQMLAARLEVDRHGGIPALKAALAADEGDPMRLVRPPLVALEGEALTEAATAIHAAVAGGLDQVW